MLPDHLNKGKSMVGKIIVVMILLVTVHCYAVDFIGGGETSGRIVVSAKAVRSEQFAAEELQKYLEKITGVKVPIVRETVVPGANSIVIGNHPANASVIENLHAKFPQDVALNRDAFAVVCDGKILHLAGNSETSSLWAAWHWLESLGVRWIMPTELGSYVPKLKSVSLKPVVTYDAPAILFRGCSYTENPKQGFPASLFEKEHGIRADELYSLRVRANCNIGFTMKDRCATLGSGHSYQYYLPVGRYFKEHPEWFNMIDGKRCNDGRWQVCFTNRGAAKEFAKNMLSEVNTWHKKYHIPIGRIVCSISPNDRNAICECPNCKRLLKKEGGNATALVLHFANMVTDELHKEYPGLKCYFYAYNNHTKPTKTIKPTSDLIPELVFWTASISVGANHSKPMFSAGNAKYRDYYRKWSSISDYMGSHTYYGHYTWFTPWPKITQMSHDIPIMARSKKFIKMYSEIHTHWGTQLPNFYLYPKLLWNPGLNVAKTMDDFYRSGFGPAGDAVRQYFGVLQKKMDSIPYVCGYLVEIPKLLTPPVMAQCSRIIARAERMLPGMKDEGQRWRTKLIVDAWKYSKKMGVAMNIYLKGRTPKQLKTMSHLLREVSDFADTEEGRWAFENRIEKHSISSVLKNSAIDLSQLPVGETVYDDSFMYGGLIKFHSEVRGFREGMWGYGLAVSGNGRLNFTVRAKRGHHFEAASIRFPLVNNGPIKVQLTAITDKGRAILVRDGSRLKKDTALPAGFRGCSYITYQLEVENFYCNPQNILYGVTLRTRVK